MESAALIKREAPDYEFRTVIAPGLSMDDLNGIADQLRPAKRWLLQRFSPNGKILDSTVLSLPVLNAAEVEKSLRSMQAGFDECRIRQ